VVVSTPRSARPSHGPERVQSIGPAVCLDGNPLEVRRVVRVAGAVCLGREHLGDLGRVPDDFVWYRQHRPFPLTRWRPSQQTTRTVGCLGVEIYLFGQAGLNSAPRPW
jgi:hypothetical protein